MAVLTAAGITFGDSTALNSKYGIIVQNSRVSFLQASDPTGWTQVVTDNDKALRVVSGTGGGVGGSISFLTAFPSAAGRAYGGSFGIGIAGAGTGGTTLGINELQGHDHGINQGGGSQARSTSTSPVRPAVTRSTPGGSTGGAGWSSGAHGHPLNLSASGSFSSALDLRVAYVDVIICSFN
jgi:hypothetical protein